MHRLLKLFSCHMSDLALPIHLDFSFHEEGKYVCVHVLCFKLFLMQVRYSSKCSSCKKLRYGKCMIDSSLCYEDVISCSEYESKEVIK